MNLEKLLRVLSDSQVTLFLQGGELRFRGPKGALTPQLREAIAEHRAAIVERLSRGGVAGGNGELRCTLCDRRNWVDEPPRDGRIRTHCGRCGRFIGYRPVGVA